jgi:hypothetical protein
MEQAECRITRIGQTRPTEAVHLYCQRCISETILGVQDDKSSMTHSVLDTDHINIRVGESWRKVQLVESLKPLPLDEAEYAAFLLGTPLSPAYSPPATPAYSPPATPAAIPAATPAATPKTKRSYPPLCPSMMKRAKGG